MSNAPKEVLEAAGKLNWCIAGVLALFGAFVMYLYLDNEYKGRQMATIQAVVTECFRTVQGNTSLPP